jgi:hypothetical protein
VAQAGTDVFVVGSATYNPDMPVAEAVAALRQALRD